MAFLDEVTGLPKLWAKIKSLPSVYPGTCTTAAATAAKVVTVDSSFVLKKGAAICIKCTYTNTAQNPTLNVNGKGAKSIYFNGGAITTGNLGYATYANRYVTFVYDGTYWVWSGWGTDNNSTYSNASLGNGYGVCDTAAATAAKVVTLSGYQLAVGGMVTVKFTHGSTVANPTLNINNKGAKPLYYRGAALTDTALIKANDLWTVVYEGSHYQLVAKGYDVDTNTTYSVATQSANGLMSAADKKKLDGVATNANNYTHPTSSGNKHIPAGGSSGQILRWSADGTAVWGADNNTDTKVTNTLATTTKSYITGTATATTNTGTQNFDTGVYLTTTAGELNAAQYKIHEKAIMKYDDTNKCISFVFA